MKAIKYLQIICLFALFVDAHAQQPNAIGNGNQLHPTFSGFMDTAMRNVERYGMSAECLYSSDKYFNGIKQEPTCACLEAKVSATEAELCRRNGSKIKVSIKNNFQDGVSGNKARGQCASSEIGEVKLLLNNNPCINRKGVFDAFGKKMHFAGIETFSDNNIPYTHYMWIGTEKNAGDTIRVTIDSENGTIRRCELVSVEKKGDLEVVLCYSYVFDNKGDTLVPIKMIFRSVERCVSSIEPFEYTITKTIALND